VQYVLEDSMSLDIEGPKTYLNLSWFNHSGLPTNQRSLLGVNLSHAHTYRVLFQPTNMLGMRGETCSTTPVTIDTTGPSLGLVVILQHDKDNEVSIPRQNYYQYSSQVLRIATRNFTDPESGILGFSVAVYRSDGWLILPETWVGNREFMTVPSDLQDRQSFFAIVKAWNHAELTTEVRSPQVVVDSSPPIIEYVRDSFGDGVRSLGGSEADAVASVDLEIGCLFLANDADSGMR
jgi:hypothetical protein